jgi:pSer/pThr/pTyr-binding forkhead associated (FHA) protein
MICAKCKADIDFDSFFCDQCGIEIMMCPTCRVPKTGKVCTSDGTKLVTAKDFAESKKTQTATISKTEIAPDNPVIIQAPKPQYNQPVQQQTPIQAPAFSQPAMSGESELVLVNNSLNIQIRPKNDDLIGRKQGSFAPIFAAYNQISGKHAQIKYNSGSGWSIIDLDSANGTTYGGKKLTPMVPQPLSDKTYLILANIEFLIQITSKDDLDRTVRI